ncbi:hypothetical protein MKLM6_4448 (plasmid) [Methylomonas koyamae]|nr:hypothetical protein MKLM6_4448 [Methylomonas koyamae]
MRRNYRVLPSGAPIAVVAETNPNYLQVSYHYDVQGFTNAVSAGHARAAGGAGRLIDYILTMIRMLPGNEAHLSRE